MWIRHNESYYSLEAVISVKADYSRHSLRLLTTDGDEQLLKLPKEMSIDEAHSRLTALLSPCEPFTLAFPEKISPEEVK
ncbi:hypothetical protein [Geopsychrobacter electrodiphilus]|uniref:hypothetical protein n=1 Tax=Geopsychrobacter electrodiphilus TaxID=225196 RepID=UPI00035E8F53|nr:hypothetical protein [Geopsychrobacter electrodiphilus]